MDIPKRKKCPSCKKTKVLSKFGLRKMHKKDKQKRPQSYCIDCRNTKRDQKPRKRVSKKTGKSDFSKLRKRNFD